MNSPSGAQAGMWVEIVVEGRLDEQWAGWFDGLMVENLPDGKAVLRGPLPDQSALHGVVMRIFNLNLPVVSICSTSAK